MWKLGHLLIQYVFTEIYLYKDINYICSFRGRYSEYLALPVVESLPFTLRMFYTSQNNFLAYGGVPVNYELVS